MVLVYIGAFLGGGNLSALPVVAVAAVATGFATAAGNTINDYFDRHIDRHTDPSRPIPRGDISPREAFVYSIVLFAATSIALVNLPTLALLLGASNLVILVIYSTWFEGIPGAGNFAVGYLVGSTLLLGGIVVGFTVPLLLLCVATALVMAGREVMKDVEDMEGDREEGLQTLPITHGKQTAVQVAAICIAAGFFVAVLPYVFGSAFSLPYLGGLLTSFVIMAISFRYTDEYPGQTQRTLKLGFGCMCLCFLFAELSVRYGLGL